MKLARNIKTKLWHAAQLTLPCAIIAMMASLAMCAAVPPGMSHREPSPTTDAPTPATVEEIAEVLQRARGIGPLLGERGAVEIDAEFVVFRRIVAPEPELLVWTWTIVEDTPDFVKPGIRRVRVGNSQRMFGWFNGDYRAYTAAVIDEIARHDEPGEPVVLMLQHWMQKAGVSGNVPEGIDPWGMFTHVDDRTAAGLPGIWPNAAMEFWTEANDHLFSELKAANINIVGLHLDTEVTPRATGPYGFDGTHEAIVADPRWATEPLRGFDGLAAADLLPPGADVGTMLFDEWIRLVGQHSFAIAYNEVFESTALQHFPDMLISDYRWHDVCRPRVHEPGDRNRLVQRASAVNHIADTLNIDSDCWPQAGVGNTAAPSLYRLSPDEALALVDELIEQYGSAKYVVPWITSRAGKQHIGGIVLTADEYRAYVAALRTRVTQVLFFNGDSHPDEWAAESFEAFAEGGQ